MGAKQLSKKEAIKLSKENPDIVYKAENGKVIYDGLTYKNEETLNKVLQEAIKEMENPSLIMRLVLGLSRLVTRVKKLFMS